MTDHETPSAWAAFWQRGGWWKAVVVAAAYYVLYQLGSIAITSAASSRLSDPNTAEYVFFGFVLPVAFGGLLLVVFALSVGWLRELFAPQPIRGHWWMWIAVVVVLGFNILRMASLDYDEAGFDLVAAWLLAGLFIGFAEETLTRGFVVNLMRKAGHGEIAVAVVSAAVFAALHAGNLFTGQSLLPTLLQLVYTFAFGICMYLALRVTGNLVWPILLHASTDPSVFLGAAYPDGSPLSAIASLGNLPVIAVGLLAVIFIRGRVTPKPFESTLA